MSAEARFDGGQGKMTTGALRIALAGNPNCGKTTVFNAYTGARQHVGNYPGVTVDRKEGHVRHGNADITLVDLPGTYSLTAYSMEEPNWAAAMSRPSSTWWMLRLWSATCC